MTTAAARRRPGRLDGEREEQRQLDDDPEDSSMTSSDLQLIPAGSRQSSPDPVDLHLDPGEITAIFT